MGQFHSHLPQLHGWTDEDPTDALTFQSLVWSGGQTVLATVNDSHQRRWDYRFEDVITMEVQIDAEIVEDWPGEIQELMRTKPFRLGRRKVSEYWIAVGNLHFIIRAGAVQLLLVGRKA